MHNNSLEQMREHNYTMKRVLFISYIFPPSGGGGVQRTVKFVKYLPDYGWSPAVLTTSASSFVQDPSLSEEIAPETPVERVRGLVLPHRVPWRIRFYIRQWLLTVDEEIGWLPFAVRRGLELVKDGSYHAIYSTAKPYTDHLVAMRIKRKTGLPWVADFRDPWIDNFSDTFATGIHRALCARLERQVVTTADRVLVVSEPMREHFLRRYGDLSPRRFVTLPNGFDPADFKKAKPVARDNRFTLAHTGSLYGKRRIAGPLLQALDRSFNNGTLSRSDICLRFIGNISREARQAVAELRLEDVVESTGYLHHREAIAHQLSADALVLIVGSGPNSDHVMTGKIFEYLAAAKPVLALTTPGVAAELLAKAGVGYVVPPDDVDAIAQGLATFVQQAREGRLRASPDPEFLSRYERPRQASELAGILDGATQAG